MSKIKDIPKDALIEMIKERVWYSGGREVYDRQGYSLEVDEGTSIRDVNYRCAELFDTPEEAISHYYSKFYKDKKEGGNDEA